MSIKFCPECNRIVDYDSYFQSYICTNNSCGWQKKVNKQIEEIQEAIDKVKTIIRDIYSNHLHELISDTLADRMMIEANEEIKIHDNLFVDIFNLSSLNSGTKFYIIVNAFVNKQGVVFTVIF